MESGKSVWRQLVNRQPGLPKGAVLWSLTHRWPSNVFRKWELEAEDGAVATLRSATFTDLRPRFLTMSELLDQVLVGLKVVCLAFSACSTKHDVKASQVNARLAAHADGEMELHDDCGITTARMTSAYATAEWVVRVQSEMGKPELPAGVRLLNRALSNFAAGSDPFLQMLGKESPRFISIDEQALAEALART